MYICRLVGFLFVNFVTFSVNRKANFIYLFSDITNNFLSLKVPYNYFSHYYFLLVYVNNMKK